MAVHVTTKCPHCNGIYRYRESNPCYLVKSPFVSCRYCGGIFIDSYRAEWITKSPLKRRFFFIGNGTWARALMLPLIISIAVFGFLLGAMLGIEDAVYLIPFGFIGTPIWLAWEASRAKKLFKKDIEESIARTKDPEYVKILKQAGYKIYPFDSNYKI